MKKLLFILAVFSIFNCSNNEDINLTTFNSELSVFENLENGVAVLDITADLGVQA